MCGKWKISYKRGLDRCYRSVRIVVSYRKPIARLLAIARLLEKTWMFRQNECPFWVCLSAEFVTWNTKGGQVYAFQSAWLMNHRNLFNFLSYRFKDRPVFKKIFKYEIVIADTKSFRIVFYQASGEYNPAYIEKFSEKNVTKTDLWEFWVLGRIKKWYKLK